jgi:hypothetical protein
MPRVLVDPERPTGASSQRRPPTTHPCPLFKVVFIDESTFWSRVSYMAKKFRLNPKQSTKITAFDAVLLLNNELIRNPTSLFKMAKHR